MNDEPKMDPTIWSSEDEISSDTVLNKYHRLRTLNTLYLIQRGIPGIKPPEIQE